MEVGPIRRVELHPKSAARERDTARKKRRERVVNVRRILKAVGSPDVVESDGDGCLPRRAVIVHDDFGGADQDRVGGHGLSKRLMERELLRGAEADGGVGEENELKAHLVPVGLL